MGGGCASVRDNIAFTLHPIPSLKEDGVFSIFCETLNPGPV